MKLIYKLLAFLAILAVIWGSLELVNFAIQPATRHVAVSQLDDDNAPPILLNAMGGHLGALPVILGIFLTVVALRLTFCKEWKELKTRLAGKTPPAALCLPLIAILLTSGCVKPYDIPQFADVKSNETAFLIPLEGQTSDQTKMNSLAYLESRKIGEKRVQIIHRWNQTGRWSTDGEWIPTVRLITVDRSQVTRQWEATSGQAHGTSQDNAIWIESADSVGFSMGFTCTAFIKEDDASTFLYWNPSNSLSNILDNEVRARIQMVSGEVAAKYKLDDLRSRKLEIVQAVKNDVIPFFSARGITITTVGMFGGMTYENPNIQSAIDQTFISQQEKVNAAAMLAAQADKNARVEEEATATAEAVRRQGKGQADAKLSLATAEAEGITLVADATSKASSNTALIRMRELEVERVKAEKWDGRLPLYSLGGNGVTTFMNISPSQLAPALLDQAK